MDKKDIYRKGDIVTFLSNLPRVHILQMFGTEPFSPDDIEEALYTGEITDIHETPIGPFYALTTLKPLEGFFCFVIEAKILGR